MFRRICIRYKLLTASYDNMSVLVDLSDRSSFSTVLRCTFHSYTANCDNFNYNVAQCSISATPSGHSRHSQSLFDHYHESISQNCNYFSVITVI